MNHIEAAVAPIKQDDIDDAKARARKQIDFWLKKLEENDWDANATAPYPSSLRCGRTEFEVAVRNHKFVRSITSADSNRPYNYRPNSPEYRVADQARIDAMINNWGEMAAQQYDAFVAKLNAKIGEVVSAVLTGNHVWSYSILTVTKADGSVERWKTQMIFKLSKLGKPHNQWPTRKVK